MLVFRTFTRLNKKNYEQIPRIWKKLVYFYNTFFTCYSESYAVVDYEWFHYKFSKKNARQPAIGRNVNRICVKIHLKRWKHESLLVSVINAINAHFFFVFASYKTNYIYLKNIKIYVIINNVLNVHKYVK